MDDMGTPSDKHPANRGINRDKKPRPLGERLRTSPAARDLRNLAQKTGEFLGLTESRNEVFHQSKDQYIYVAPQDTERFAHLIKHGVRMETPQGGNVVSIMKGVAIRGAKEARKPEGY